MLALGFGFWRTWELYDPSNGFIGGQKVTFDGPNKLILINYGETEIDVEIDIYSGWKEWMTSSETAMFLPAIRVVGGDPIDQTRSVGGTFFLINGWKIRTWSGDHALIVSGNLYSDDGLDPFVTVLGDYTTSIRSNVSNLIDVVAPEVDVSDINITTEQVVGGMSVAQFLALKD